MRVSVYTVGKQPCAALLRGDSSCAALGEGNRRNVHQCPVCWGRRTWCDNCSSDHHEHGWESCTKDAYRAREVADDQPAFGYPEWVEQSI
jgi:hypothetical protein